MASARGRHRYQRPVHPRRSRGRLFAALGAATTIGAATLVATAPLASAANAQLTVPASQDAYVSAAAPNTTYNTGRLSASSSPDDRKTSYLTFVVPSLPPTATDVVARLELTRDMHHLPSSVELHSVPDTNWSERSLTMRNAPKIGTQLDTVAPTATTTQISFSLPTVRGAGTFSFAVTSKVTNDVARFRSSEYGTDVPRVVLSYRIPGQPAPPPGNGSLQNTWIGAAASDPIPGGGIDYGIGVFNDRNAEVGPLTYRRSFDSTLPTSFQTSAAAQDQANGYRSFVSWKPPNGDYVGAANGRYDDQVTAWARSVPTYGVYATAFHEPENDMTGPQFVAMQRHLYTVVKAANPSIRWGPVYMAYWWDDGTNHYVGNKDAWWPGNDYADFTAVDVYSNDARPLETHPEFRGWYDYMLGTGKQMIIAEYGQYVVKPGQTADPAALADRAATIRQDAAWLAEQGTISMWLYWDAMGDKGDWRLTDPQSQAAWRDVAASGRTK